MLKSVILTDDFSPFCARINIFDVPYLHSVLLVKLCHSYENLASIFYKVPIFQISHCEYGNVQMNNGGPGEEDERN